MRGVIYFDGADFSGKTTNCERLYSQMKYTEKVAIIHFPIRDRARDIRIDSGSELFSICPSFSGKSALEVQNIIAEHMEENSKIMETLDYTFILDRFILSNIVYRIILCKQLYTLSDYKLAYPASYSIYQRANTTILVEPLKVLLGRKGLRQGKISDELDEMNETEMNINLANNVFANLAKKMY
jgi:thymidylate kinase